MNSSTVAHSSPRFVRLAATAVTAAMLSGGLVVAGSATAQAAEALPATFLSTAATTWSYSDNNTDPAAGATDRLAWTAGAFDDSAWKTGKGAFGAKKGAATGIGADFPINTLLNQYIPGTTDTDVPTFHFRTSFDLTQGQLSEISGLTGTATFDDAVQVFVNGKKVAGFADDRVEAAPEAQRNLTYAGTGAGDPITGNLEVPASALVAGENIVSVALYQDRASSSDIYFDLKSLSPVLANAPEPEPVPVPDASLTNVVLTIGATEKERNVTWYSNVDTEQGVQFAPASAMTGDEFPAAAATSSPATGGPTTSGEFRRSANIAALAENTAYVYRVGSEATGWSDTYRFATAAFTGAYDFLFFGDPQIGASGNVANDQTGWTDTLNVAQATYPKSELLFSAGDQVEHAANETEYDAFLAPEQLREIPLVPTNGNHDVGSKAYEQHYTVPNNDPTAGAGGATSSGGDYWFMYKDVLYLNINSNNGDIASHKTFLDRVVAEQGAKAKWKILAFHHSIYSQASHTNDTQIKDLRGSLPTIISDLGIDLVLQGHDHSYTRTRLIKDGALADATELPGQAVVEPTEGEVLYVTANSASGSKYYNYRDDNQIKDLVSVYNQEKVRNYSHINVTDNALTVETLRSQQNGDEKPVNSVVDTVTLKRADVTAPVLDVPAKSSVEFGSTFDPKAGITATDAVDGDLTASITVDGTVDTGKLGDYTLVYSVTDAAGNVATATRVVTVVEGALEQVTAPAIGGPATVKVGTTLTATPGTWTPQPTGTSYQWLRNGVAIAGATGASYTTVSADAGASITVRVDVTRAGFADATAVSAAVAVVAADAVLPTPTPSAPGAPAGGTGSGNGSGNGSLASTGFDGASVGALAAMFLLLGGAMFFALRHRRRA